MLFHVHPISWSVGQGVLTRSDASRYRTYIRALIIWSYDKTRYPKEQDQAGRYPRWGHHRAVINQERGAGAKCRG